METCNLHKNFNLKTNADAGDADTGDADAGDADARVTRIAPLILRIVELKIKSLSFFGHISDNVEEIKIYYFDNKDLNFN